jgi:hypothetical protein
MESGSSNSRRIAALAGLVESRLPAEMAAMGPRDAWPLVGTGLLAHCAAIAQSVDRLELSGAENDAFRLLRSLYDHAVMFAWLAVDAPTRLMLWRLDDLGERLKADRETRAWGEPLLADADRDAMTRELAGTTLRLPDVASRAQAANAHWGAQFNFLRGGGATSLRGMYTLVFRTASGLVHPTFRGLNRVTEDISFTERRVVSQTAPGDSRPSGVAGVVLGLTLIISSEALGWPDRETVCAVFEAAGGAV